MCPLSLEREKMMQRSVLWHSFLLAIFNDFAWKIIVTHIVKSFYYWIVFYFAFFILIPVIICRWEKKKEKKMKNSKRGRGHHRIYVAKWKYHWQWLIVEMGCFYYVFFFTFGELSSHHFPKGLFSLSLCRLFLRTFQRHPINRSMIQEFIGAFATLCFSTSPLQNCFVKSLGVLIYSLPLIFHIFLAHCSCQQWKNKNIWL